MANADKPMGFKVGYTKHGGPPRMQRYYTSGTAAIYIGDVVIVESVPGYVAPYDAGSELPLGVAATHADASAATTTEIYVYNDLENTIFIAQADGADISAVTLTNLYYDILPGTASTTTDYSVMEIDSDASDHDNLLVIDKVDRPDNAWGAYVDCYVEFVVNAHAHTRTPTGT